MSSTRLRIGDVVGEYVVVAKRMHPVVRRMEVLCDRVHGHFEGVYVCFWQSGTAAAAERRDLRLAARKLRLAAADTARKYRAARKVANRKLWTSRWTRLAVQSRRLDELADRIDGNAVPA